jgi:PAS domain-containing protein
VKKNEAQTFERQAMPCWPRLANAGGQKRHLAQANSACRIFLDNTTAVVFVKDLDLRYILVNREYERRHQVRRDQICGKTDFDIHSHDVADTLWVNDRHVIEAGTPIQLEEAVPMTEGDRQYVVVKFLLRDRTTKRYAMRAPKSRGSGDPSSLERWLKHPPSNA